MYLLDTNTCIFAMGGKFGVDKHMSLVGLENCHISEITVLELKCGAIASRDRFNNWQRILNFISLLHIEKINTAFDVFSEEKTRLKKAGEIIPDFDILIGATSIANELVMVTNNTKHFSRLQNIKLEDWTNIK